MKKRMKQKNNFNPTSSQVTLTQPQINDFLQNLKLPSSNSHKGQNGKLLIIGGSQLFHSASRWSLDVASKFVDMVFYSSVIENNQLIQEAKQYFWNGIVVARQEVENYAREADCILIGPGMERQEKNSNFNDKNPQHYLDNPPNNETWQNNTQKVVNYLLAKFPQKKWVVDAGALQMVDIKLLNKNCIITPHEQELLIIAQKAEFLKEIKNAINGKIENLNKLSKKLNYASILFKGQADIVVHRDKAFIINGGNAGMTKGGTGDVLAGLLAGLYSNNDILPSMIAASYINKAAGDHLFKKIGPFFNATNLVETIPEVLWSKLKK